MTHRKSTRTLLVAGGVLNALFALFHVWLGWRIGAGGAPEGARGLMLALNAGGTLFIAFFAYAFLARGADLVSTGLGRAALVACLLLYWSRAVEEIVWFRFSPAIFAACLIAGAVPAALLALSRR
jgi:hypothetical protein